MTNARLIAFAIFLPATLPVFAQSVVSTHSGVVYFFDGNVFLAGEPLMQKFGRFPDIAEGGELRTADGRAEVLLTPGGFLRLAENSSIRMVSNKLSDTQVEFLSGSAIIELNEPAPDTTVQLIFKDWRVRVPKSGVYRIDSTPPQMRVYKGEAEVATMGKIETIAVKEGNVLPFASVLVADRAPTLEGDSFKRWAMSRSQAISADNAIASEIVDNPNQTDSSGLPFGGFSYFPLTGIPSMGIGSPYGLSFWSPYQSALSSVYFPPYYSYGYLYSGWPVGARIFSRGIGTRGFGTPGVGTPGVGVPYRTGFGMRPTTGTIGPTGTTVARPPAVYSPRPAPHPVAPHPGAAPHAVGRAGGGHR